MRPKLAVESLSISSRISCSLLALRAQSSANRKSLITVSFNFVTVCRRLMLKNVPSYLCLMLILATQSLYASVSIAKNIYLDSVGAKRQPCLTPLETGKDFDGSSYYNQTVAIIIVVIFYIIIIIITSDTNKSKL